MREDFVNILASHHKARNYHVQMLVRQLEHEADARLFQRQRKLLSRFSQAANQALDNQREVVKGHQKYGDETGKYTIYVQNSVIRLNLEDVTPQQKSRTRWNPSALAGLVEETQQYREIFEESRVSHPATGPEIERLREAELPREVRRQRTTEQDLMIRYQGI